MPMNTQSVTSMVLFTCSSRLPSPSLLRRRPAHATEGGEKEVEVEGNDADDDEHQQRHELGDRW